MKNYCTCNGPKVCKTHGGVFDFCSESSCLCHSVSQAQDILEKVDAQIGGAARALGGDVSTPTTKSWERFEATNPRATLLDGFLYFREADIKAFITKEIEAARKEGRRDLDVYLRSLWPRYGGRRQHGAGTLDHLLQRFPRP